MSNPYSQTPQQFNTPNNPNVYGGNGGYQPQPNNLQQGMDMSFQNISSVDRNYKQINIQ